MFNLKEKLMLTDKGYADLKKAIVACTLTNLSLMLPFGITIQIFGEMLKPLLGEEISWTKMWIYFGRGGSSQCGFLNHSSGSLNRLLIFLLDIRRAFRLLNLLQLVKQSPLCSIYCQRSNT